LASQEQYEDIGWQVYVAFSLFLGEGSYENPLLNRAGGICLGSPTVSQA
jgi:hypothetical protein